MVTHKQSREEQHTSTPVADQRAHRGQRKTKADKAKEEKPKEEKATQKQAALEAVEEGDRDRTFFSIWTLKEAYLKAQGTGISVPLDGFAVLSAGAESVLLRQDGEFDAAQRWKLVTIELDGGYVAAVCAEGKDWQLERRDWPPACRLTDGARRQFPAYPSRTRCRPRTS